jgi:hypothetical protein
MIKVRYTKELLLSLFPPEGKAKLIGSYETTTCNTRIKYICDTSDCEGEGDKTFDRLCKSGIFCNKCTFKRGSEAGIKTLQKTHGSHIKNANDLPGMKEKIKAVIAEKHGFEKQKQLGQNLAEHRKAHWEKQQSTWVDIEKKGTMKCRVCNIEKKLEYFPKGVRKYKTWQTQCYDCKNVKRTANTLEWSKTAPLEEIFKEQLYNANKRATKRGKYTCDITVAELIEIYNKQSGKCYISGRELKTEVGHLDRISIDRIDSTKGYTKENVGLVCSQINLIKLDMSVELLLTYVKDIYEHNGVSNLNCAPQVEPLIVSE